MNYTKLTANNIYDKCIMYKPLLYTISKNALKGKDSYIDDAIQETYISAIENYSNKSYSESEFKEHICKLCKKNSLKYYYQDLNNPASPNYIINYNKEDEDIDYELSILYSNETDPLEKIIAKEELGLVKKYKNRWLPFDLAREYVRYLSLQSIEDWKEYCNSNNKISNIPDEPHLIYSSFINYDNWLGIKKRLSNNVNNKKDTEFKYLNYKDAQKWVEDNLSKYVLTEKTWHKNLSKIPNNIPKNPNIIYKGKGWSTWYNWFGRQRDITRKYNLTYIDFKKWVNENLYFILNEDDWNKYKNKLPDNIPSEPHIVYKNRGWVGYSFLLRRGLGNKNNPKYMFGSQYIKIKYNEEYMWVNPYKLDNTNVYAKVEGMIHSIPYGSDIVFDIRNIAQIPNKRKEDVNKIINSLLNIK